MPCCLHTYIDYAFGLSDGGNWVSGWVADKPNCVHSLVSLYILASVCVLLTLQVPIRISAGLNPDCGELTKLPGLIITSHLSQHPLMINNFNGQTKKKEKRNRFYVCIEEGHWVNKEVKWVCTHIGHMKCPGHAMIQNRTWFFQFWLLQTG